MNELDGYPYDQCWRRRLRIGEGPTDRLRKLDFRGGRINCLEVHDPPALKMFKHFLVFFILALQGLLAAGFTNPIKQTDGSDPFMVSVSLELYCA